ncbi:hypothetical protein [Chitinophaga solisilvae]|uniref:HU domain-containing protein n=1 Tax=Chitinophaga solisilvae TaxID=1233460 RepID=UPI00136E5DED|nr:hypothetical protein [Chitinophaga solisilvae]
MIIQQYIQEVLFRQRVCVVPQLGTFSIQHFPAQYNASAQTLMPPRDQIIFSQSWQDDGSLLEWIGLKENLVPSVAQRKMEKYLEELKASLKDGKTLELAGIGKLQGDFTGNVHFYAEELPINPESLPISPIHRQPATPVAPEPPVPTEPLPLQELEPVMTEEEEDTLEAVTDNSIFSWWRATAALAFLLGGLAIWYFVSRQAPRAETAETPDMPAHDTAATAVTPADSATIAATPVVSDSISYLIVIEAYKDSTTAAKKMARRKSWKQFELVLIKKDSLYSIALPVTSLPADTTARLDSTRSKYGTAHLKF